jgi:hypothetical protein
MKTRYPDRRDNTYDYITARTGVVLGDYSRTKTCLTHGEWPATSPNQGCPQCKAMKLDPLCQCGHRKSEHWHGAGGAESCGKPNCRCRGFQGK